MFFFKQKTAYEMRISDWSSDVCSSDLAIAPECAPTRPATRPCRSALGRDGLPRENRSRHGALPQQPKPPCQPAHAGHCSLHPIRQDAIMASKTSWAAFPHDAKAYAFAGDALKKAWPKLHAGDCAPFPDDTRAAALLKAAGRSEEHTSELQSLMRISYAVFCLKKQTQSKKTTNNKYSNT